MKTIGLIGGMSWESTLEYYRILNEQVKLQLGGLHSARCLLYSVDFAEVEEQQRSGRWEDAADLMTAAALSLQRGGADFVVICTNTMHKLVEVMQPRLDIPILHIADATAAEIHAAGLQRVALLGTRFTMEEDFYRGRLEKMHGLTVLIPPADARQRVHDVIYQELCLGITREASREQYRAIIRELVAQGAQGIILGCTEIGLLVKPEDSPVPLFDTTSIHACAAVKAALQDEKQ